MKSRQTPSTIEDLIHPFDERYAHADDFIEWLDSAVLACQILQISTTSFPEGEIDVKKDAAVINDDDDKSLQAAFDEMLRSLPFTKPSTVRRQLERPRDSIDGIPLNYSQLLQLLAENYTYETGEQALSRRICKYLSQKSSPHNNFNSTQQQLLSQKDKTKDKSANEPTQIDLIDLSAAEDSIASPPALFRDSNQFIPFQLPQFCDISQQASSPNATAPPPGWQTGLESPDDQKKRSESWERVRIEVPGWLLKAIDNGTNASSAETKANQ
jgi:hypothetical protein